MQDRPGQSEAHSQHSYAGTTDSDAAASTAALTERLDRLGIGQIGTAANSSSNNGSNGLSSTENAVAASAGQHALSSTAAGALIEDNDFDDSMEELNRDLPPHACR